MHHIDSIKSKLSKSLYMLRSLKPYIDKQGLLTLYSTMALSFITYGILLWGGTHNYLLKKVDVMQKKLIRIINKLDYNAHTLPFFNKCNILKLEDMYKCEQSIFM